MGGQEHIPARNVARHGPHRRRRPPHAAPPRVVRRGGQGRRLALSHLLVIFLVILLTCRVLLLLVVLTLLNLFVVLIVGVVLLVGRRSPSEVGSAVVRLMTGVSRVSLASLTIPVTREPPMGTFSSFVVWVESANFATAR